MSKNNRKHTPNSYRNTDKGKKNERKKQIKIGRWTVTDLSVNFCKLYRARNSSDKQQVPTTAKASSVTLTHCIFRTFKRGHPLATASIPLSLTYSESNDKVSRDLQCNPTASNEISVIFAQAATPRVFNDFPQPSANSTTPASVKPSQKRKFKSSSRLQHCPTAARPGSPT